MYLIHKARWRMKIQQGFKDISSKCLIIQCKWRVYLAIKKRRYKETLLKWDQIKSQLIKPHLDLKEKHKKNTKSKQYKKAMKMITKYQQIKSARKKDGIKDML